MEDLAHAILCTLAYADVFEHPLTEAEIHKYLIAAPASRAQVHRVLLEELLPSGLAASRDGHYMLPGREGTLATRRQRQAVSARLWPRARRYGRWIGRLPYVRMVAVTGSLAVESADSQADLDYLIVTRAGRLWVTRAMVILLVRLASRRGDTLCPNYFLSERSLAVPQHNLFTAHEFVQMVPLVGAPIYQRMWQLNGWVCAFLPNAENQFPETAPGGLYQRAIRPRLETLLAGRAVGRLEAWEMGRKQARYRQSSAAHPEAHFGADICKGHFQDHGQRILEAYEARLQALFEVSHE